jgi:hypothetical protein
MCSKERMIKMEKMRFHWKNGDRKGSFTVTAFSIEECIKMAEEEVKESEGYVITDYYAI